MARAVATARPIPRLAPVTKAIFLSIAHNPAVNRKDAMLAQV
jgi:hypothetical protein